MEQFQKLYSMTKYFFNQTRENQYLMKKLFLILSIAFFFSCNSGSSNDNMNNEMSYKQAEGEMAEMDYDESSSTMAMAEQKKEDGSSQGSSDKDQQSQSSSIIKNRKLIKTADLQIEVEVYKDARKALGSMVKKHDAFIANERENKSYYQLANTITIRIDPKSFDTFLNEVEGIALNVSSKSVNTKDVTSQFVDMETRLISKRKVVEQYQSILKKAHTIKDIMAVQEKLRRIIEEIESVEGQLKYMRDQIGLSTITITLTQALEQKPRSRKSFFGRLGSAFSDGWHGLGELVLGLTSIWPILIIMIGGVYFFGRFIRRRRKG